MILIFGRNSIRHFLERLYLFTAQEGGHGSNPFAGRTEDTWIIHRILYRGVKTVIKDKLLETMRQAYFLPLLPRFLAQRDVERTLHTLAVTYAARDSALGALVLSELHDIANSLAISDAILSDYVQLSDRAWSGGAAVPWNRLLSGPAPDAGRVETWVRFFRELQQAYRAQTVGSEQLRRLQQGAGPLMRVADAVRGKRKLAQMLNAISEESPLVAVPDRCGGAAGCSLSPWSFRQQAPQHQPVGGNAGCSRLDP